MTSIILAAGAVSAIGLLCATILAAASKIMHVPVDERTELIRECLPGANCGACGYAGCDGYAAALTSEEGTATNMCTPGGSEVSQKISGILGVDFADVAQHVAVVKCAGDAGVTRNKMNYSGIETCAGAKLFYNGQGACSYSCLGFGDCARVCPNGAISTEGDVAHVDMDLCSGCGMCAKACPKGVIELIPAKAKSIVLCSNRDKGALTRAACSAGCIACGKCVKQCEAGAITIMDNLAFIDGFGCSGCGKCADVCPSKSIRFTGVPCEGVEHIMFLNSLLLQGAKKQ